MPSTGAFEPSLTGLFEAGWRPRKAVTVLWRRVETISPGAFAIVTAWAYEAAAGEPLSWLDVMATNEAVVEPAPAMAELNWLLQRQPPADVAEALELLRDLIWEACDSNSDWLTWRPCRACGRRWATVMMESVALCPRHHAAPVLAEVLRDEMATYDGLVDHTAAIERLERLPATIAGDHVAPTAVNGAEPHDADHATAQIGRMTVER